MKLTIIPSDGAVYENGIAYLNLTWAETPPNVHALQWKDTAGWIEYNDGTVNEDITVLPQWADNAMVAWQVAYDEAHKPPTPPTPPTYEQKYALFIAERDRRLLATDYTQLPDVIALHDAAWLQGWVDYRQELRDLPSLVNQSNIDNISWPVPPVE